MDTNWLSALDHAATVLLVVGTVIGVVCANLDADTIEADGWPRLAWWIRLGRELGGLAKQIRKFKSGAPSSDPAPSDKGGAS